ncbi:hypothetical protein OG921_04685 [Aldersonia sp. NBC_00410]|uniref:hypothetical protein n=1 Tax=Aldersonia sp. NBC_00410 TaxID=2975954 RepID=UPI002259CDCB|nr:hypothetical protein [Aldersonia sp. NBC_00410]MCX5042469.1 hypothetical protein [Aldersonia sp. NBC_00410]
MVELKVVVVVALSASAAISLPYSRFDVLGNRTGCLGAAQQHSPVDPHRRIHDDRKQFGVAYLKRSRKRLRGGFEADLRQTDARYPMNLGERYFSTVFVRNEPNLPIRDDELPRRLNWAGTKASPTSRTFRKVTKLVDREVQGRCHGRDCPEPDVVEVVPSHQLLEQRPNVVRLASEFRYGFPKCRYLVICNHAVGFRERNVAAEAIQREPFDALRCILRGHPTGREPLIEIGPFITQRANCPQDLLRTLRIAVEGRMRELMASGAIRT